MTYCCRRVSSTGSKPLIPRASSPPDWRIGNSFAYKCADSIADKATRCAPSSFDPTLHPRGTDSAVSQAVRSAGPLLKEYESRGEREQTDGSPKLAGGANHPAGGGNSRHSSPRNFMNKKDRLSRRSGDSRMSSDPMPEPPHA
jgi:hypothetical protein